MELGNIHPEPPAIRLFDAGVGDGTVLTRVMRSMHSRFPFMPFYVVGKEISLEDVRLALDKMPDRFTEHPATVLVMTNLHYAEAPWLMPHSVAAATSLVWHEVALSGQHGRRVRPPDHRPAAVPCRQLARPCQREERQSHLRQAGRAGSLSRGLPVPARPGAAAPLAAGGLRSGHRLAALPRPRLGRVQGGAGDRAAGAALGPGGRLIGIHSRGDDPGLEIIRRVWPGEIRSVTDRHEFCAWRRAKLGAKARALQLQFLFGRALEVPLRDAHPAHEIGTAQSAIGTSTLLAAWNAATYVAQIEDQRLSEAIARKSIISRQPSLGPPENHGLWFWDKSYVISRKRDAL